MNGVRTTLRDPFALAVLVAALLSIVWLCFT